MDKIQSISELRKEFSPIINVNHIHHSKLSNLEKLAVFNLDSSDVAYYGRAKYLRETCRAAFGTRFSN